MMSPWNAAYQFPQVFNSLLNICSRRAPNGLWESTLNLGVNLILRIAPKLGVIYICLTIKLIKTLHVFQISGRKRFYSRQRSLEIFAQILVESGAVVVFCVTCYDVATSSVASRG